MKKNFKNLRKLKNEDGFTLLEMIIAMGIMSIVIPFMITMTSTSVQVKNNANSATTNILSASAVNSNLTEDIKTAAYTNVTPNRISIRSGSNVSECKVWEVRNGNLYKAYSNTTINESSKWILVGEKVAAKATGIYFTPSDSGLISYSLNLGDKHSAMTISGSAKPRIAAGGPGLCR